MATVISLDDAAKARADELIRSGNYSSFDEVVKAALEDGGGWIDEAVDFDDLPPHVRTAIEEGLADEAAGRLVDADEVFTKLRARFGAN